MSPPITSGGASPTRVCVDASFVLHLLLPDEHDARIDSVWQTWSAAGNEVIGPALLYAEVTSVLRLRVVTGRLTADEGEQAFAAFNALGIRRVDRDDLYSRAWHLSNQFRTRRTYDMLYLALAQLEDVDLWTGDERMVNTVGTGDARLRWMPAINSSPP